MATFTLAEIQNTLPDPDNRISYAGDTKSANSGSAFGPGYASVQLTSEQKNLRDRTNSGRVLARSIAAHKWKVSIRYNPMTQTQFDPIYAFLINRRGAVNPFFVQLPQYNAPRDSNFNTWSNASTSNRLSVDGSSAIEGGITSALISKAGYSNTSNGTPRPGDLFTINDSTNSNHLKAYMVTRVETSSDYQSGTSQPGSTQVRLHFTPGLSRRIGATAEFTFTNPKIRVVLANDVQQYSLNTNNLYEYSLSLEEAQ